MLKYVSLSKNVKRKTEDGECDRRECKQHRPTDKMSLVKHVKGDLFQAEKESLAHCISADIHMGKGIALLFKQKFGCVEKLRKQNKKPGEVAVLPVKDRFVYYLVTKEKYWHKPTYATLRTTLEHMKTHCVEHQVQGLAMPKIGCGLDKLEWPKVQQILNEVFHGTDIVMTVYSL